MLKGHDVALKPGGERKLWVTYSALAPMALEYQIERRCCRLVGAFGVVANLNMQGLFVLELSFKG